jgi:FKBP-type peptidyl-prolyl cis-trans isomerase
VVVEEFVIGEGTPSGDGMMISFNFKGYASASGQPVMGSRGAPSRLTINETTRTQEPIAKAIAEGIDGMKPGGKRRIKVPADIVEGAAPPGRPSIGDLMITLELLTVAPAPVLQKVDAYQGTPIASDKRSNGLEIYDYVAGDGPAAKNGDQVVTHYIGHLADGTEFDSSHARADGMPVVVGGPGVIPGFAQGMEGAKAGMLRKIVIPPDLGYGDADRGKIPPNSTLTFYLQIMSVTPGTGPTQSVTIPVGPEGKPADKPKNEQPKPEKPEGN